MAFEQKLVSYVPAIIIEPGSAAPFFDIEQFFSQRAFLNQQCFGGKFFPGKVAFYAVDQL